MSFVAVQRRAAFASSPAAVKRFSNVPLHTSPRRDPHPLPNTMPHPLRPGSAPNPPGKSHLFDIIDSDLAMDYLFDKSRSIALVVTSHGLMSYDGWRHGREREFPSRSTHHHGECIPRSRCLVSCAT